MWNVCTVGKRIGIRVVAVVIKPESLFIASLMIIILPTHDVSMKLHAMDKETSQCLFRLSEVSY